MKELDVVESIVKIENIEPGTTGVIIYIHEGYAAREVEFFDEDDDTIAVITCKYEQLKYIGKNF